MEIGDATLRSDVELLASARAVDTVTTQLPLPWAGLMDRLNDPQSLSGQPDYIISAADRLRERGKTDTAKGWHYAFSFDATGSPAVVRGYDALGRQSLESQASVEYVGPSTVVHLNLGARSVTKSDSQVFVPDGSYIAQRLGDTVVYAGYMSHWWGPGWISALSLSTNARPVPQIGITRISTTPFSSPWLSWIGPWQVEFFVGVLDGPRVARNTIYDGFRFAFSPLPGLELGLSRTDMMCGSGHPCKPLVGYFDLQNDNSQVNSVNDQGSIDIRYTGVVADWSYAAYTQIMNEDTNPFVHSGSVHLYGASLWHPYQDGVARLTVEYADSTPSLNMFSGPAMHGFAYNNYSYRDGMRYRGRTLGFSLDSDSRLFSVQGAFTDHAARTYTLIYHRAKISDPLNLPGNPQETWGNVVTTGPVNMNVVQARVSLPIAVDSRDVHLDVELRAQDDQPRPRRGGLATAEVALRVRL
jgi:hypothetical protein